MRILPDVSSNPHVTQTIAQIEHDVRVALSQAVRRATRALAERPDGDEPLYALVAGLASDIATIDNNARNRAHKTGRA